MANFSDIHFEKYRKFIYETFGINFKADKKEVLQIKLYKLMSKNNIDSYDELYNILTCGRNKQILVEFTNEITINKTDFFREMNHFNFIKNKLDFVLKNNQRIIKNNEIRIWSSACSTGEEPYTIAMILKEVLSDGMNIKILATDISSRVLKIAQQGIYQADIKNEVDIYYLHKYFDKTNQSFEIIKDIKKLVTFRAFNLMESFPFKDTFDIIFCRNVMIYFDNYVQQELLDKFYKVIPPGGLLFIGHSESLSNKKHGFKYIEPTIYMK